MFRVLLSLLVLAAGLQTSTAVRLPSFPQQAHVAKAKEVKSYWTRTLRWHCRNLRSRSVIEDKKRLIKAIELGLYDDLAEIAALRSNIAYLEFHELYIAAQRAKDRIAAIHQERAAIASAARPEPLPPAVQPVAADAQPADNPVIYVDESWIDEDCPPHDSHVHDPHSTHYRPGRPHYRPGHPHIPIPTTPGRPTITLPPRPTPAPKPPKGVISPRTNRLVTQPSSRPSKPSPSYTPQPTPRRSSQPSSYKSSSGGGSKSPSSSGSSYRSTPAPSSQPSSRPSPSPAPQSPSPSKQAFPMRR